MMMTMAMLLQITIIIA